MAYDLTLVKKVSAYLADVPGIIVKEQKMMGGLAFMINGKMCINVSGNRLMCRFDPSITDAIAKRKGFVAMIMKGKEYKGYCYVAPEGFKSKKDFEFWMNLCLDFNDSAKASRK